MSVVAATLQAEFAAQQVDPANPDPSQVGRVPLKWAYDTGVTLGDRIPLRLYPSLGGSSVGTGGTRPGSLSVRASNGRLYAKGNGEEVIAEELVTFSGSDRASTERPIDTLLSATFLGDCYAVEDGAFVSASPRLTADPVSGELVAARAFYGDVLVSYRASFRRFDFEHDPTASPLPGFVGGRVFASYGGSIADMTITVQEPEGGANYFVVALVKSQYLAVSQDADPDGEQGAWEQPVGWPDVTAWPGYGDIDPAGTVPQERTHATVAVNEQGSMMVRHNRDVEWGRPFELDTNYNPVYRLALNTRGLPERVTVDPERIREYLQPFYPGI